tara:strand:- start:158 stop:289 length:132 start_codon:yes stop_codon:yes gene_type:complete
MIIDDKYGKGHVLGDEHCQNQDLPKDADRILKTDWLTKNVIQM